MLNVGDKVPDFTLPLAFADGRKDPVAFHTLLGKGPILIAFYPLAFSGTCTQEMCDIRDSQRNLETLNAQTIGYSIDSAFTNVAFAKAHAYTHGIYSDPNRRVINTIWETMTIAGVEHAAKRGYLIITPQGTVAQKWVTDDPDEWIGTDAIQATLTKT